jgi:hypothetical protein
MDKREPFVVPYNWTLVNWGKSMLIGSFLWPLLFFCFLSEYTDVPGDVGLTICAYLIFSSVSVLGSIVLTIPSVLLLLVAGAILNRINLTPTTYCVYQNLVYIVIASFTMLAIHYYELDKVCADGEFLLIGGSFIVSGLVVWNKMYYDLRKARKTTTKTPQL